MLSSKYRKRILRKLLGLAISGATLLSACDAVQGGLTPTIEYILPTPVVSTLPGESEQNSTPVAIPASPHPIEMAGFTATPDPYDHLTHAHLSQREFGGGEVTIHEIMTDYRSFTRYLISYPSDGLDIFGFMNIPHGEGPFPVVIALHGYVDPSDYQILDYTTHYADVLAQAGFLVIHPNLRGYPPSDDGENLFRVGMATDVLNLAAIVRQGAGRPGSLERADGHNTGLWGHSMGGGIALRALTIDPKIDSAILYGSMSGDEAKNFQKIFEWSDSERGVAELAVPEEVLEEVSSINFLENIQAVVSVHHGGADTLVPLAWSEDLCRRLPENGVEVSCYTYPDQPHTFHTSGDQLFINRMIQFFSETLELSNTSEN